MTTSHNSKGLSIAQNLSQLFLSHLSKSISPFCHDITIISPIQLQLNNSIITYQNIHLYHQNAAQIILMLMTKHVAKTLSTPHHTNSKVTLRNAWLVLLLKSTLLDRVVRTTSLLNHWVHNMTPRAPCRRCCVAAEKKRYSDVSTHIVKRTKKNDTTPTHYLRVVGDFVPAMGCEYPCGGVNVWGIQQQQQQQQQQQPFSPQPPRHWAHSFAPRPPWGVW